jgi:hypothetical protein
MSDCSIKQQNGITVTPVPAFTGINCSGVQNTSIILDSRLRGNDKDGKCFNCYKIIHLSPVSSNIASAPAKPGRIYRKVTTAEAVCRSHLEVTL